MPKNRTIIVPHYYVQGVQEIPKAFPGAEGFGTLTRGAAGYSGTPEIYFVTNTNNSGAGSFRDAVSQSGRFIIFKTSGIIDLQTNITITASNLTIAGQTSPGGILITGATVRIQGQEIVIRHMRFKVGPGNTDPNSLDALAIYGPGDNHPPGAKNVVVDHCSMAWSADEVWSTAYGPTDWTMSNCMFVEPQRNGGHDEVNHAMGPFISTGSGFTQDCRGTMHHCYIAHAQARMPEIQSNLTFENFLDFRNNVVYDYNSNSVGKLNARARVNLVENYVRPGPLSNSGMYEFRHSPGTGPEPSIYVFHNWGAKTGENDGDTVWNIADGFSTTTTTDQAWRRTPDPWPTPDADVTTSRMTAAYAASVVANAGATKPVRDTHDGDMNDQYTNGEGGFRLSVTFPDDYPTFSDEPYPQDTDNDGIPDSYEIANGFTATGMNALAAAPSGYLWIEEYINSLA